MGPAVNICVEEDASRIMQTSVLDIVSFHSYPDGSGGGHVSHNEITMPNMWADLSNATWLRQSGPESDYAHTYSNATACIRAHNSLIGSKTPELWLTETNAAYTALQNGSDAFLNLYWYATSLGQYAAAGLNLHTYFTLVGGGAAMIGCDPYVGCGYCSASRMRPYPTYYFAVLHKRLVGTKVLRVAKAVGANDPLVFAHCSKNRTVGVVLLFVNPSLHPVKLGEKREAGQSGKFEQYTLTPHGSVNSSYVLLNDELLTLTSGGKLPSMSPVKHAATDDVLMPASSVGFVVFPQAEIQACVFHDLG
jgi:hypothetical protein